MLLREACDKAKRIPPRYRETRCNDPPDTWHSKCVLADKKVANNDIVCFTKGKCEPQPSAMEASQMAAVVALHRLCAGLQMHRVLPKRYRPLWEVLDEGREEREEKAALRAKREEKRKEREARQQQREERERRQVTSVYMSPDRLEVIKGLLDGVAGAGTGAGAGRPGLDDGKRSTEGDWDDSDGEGGDGGDARPDVDDLATQLSSMGFDANDASTAARRHPGELSAALDWLLLTLDDESLPARFAARGSAKHIDVRVMRPARAQGAAMDAEADPSPALEDPGWPTDAGAAPSTQLPDAAAEELEALGAIYADELAAGDGGSADTPEGCYALTLAEGDASVQMRWRFPEGYPERAPLHLRVAAIAGVGPNALAEMGAAASARASALQADGEVAVFELAEMLKEQLRRPTRELTSKAKASTADDVREERDVRRGAEDAPPQKPAKPPRRNSPRQPQQRREAGPRVSESERRAENERLRALEEDRRAGRGPGAALAAVRARLPAAGSRDEVLTALARARVLIIHGATGCGKSTQVPQFILEAEAAAGRGGAASVVVTQPRRISAVGVAERVAAERGEPCGDVVGYTVRLDRKASRRTRLMFCTTGVLLRRLQSDPLLRDVTHVVVDEVHERSVECDLLLLLLRQALTRNDALKVVLMSATLDAEAFAEYFARPTGGSADGDDKGIGSRPVPLPPVVTIPGFTHPVRDLYLEDVLELTRFRIGAKNRYAKRTTSAMPAASRDQVGGGRSTTDAASRQGAAQQRLSTLADKNAAAAAEAKPAVLQSPGAELDSWEDDDGDVGAGSEAEEASTAAERERAEAAAAAARGEAALAEASQRAAERAALADHAESKERALIVREIDRQLASYSADTQRSLAHVDESVINYDLIEALVACILDGTAPLPEGPAKGVNRGGAILVFLPGMAEIRTLQRALEGSDRLRGEAWVVPLHGSLPPKDQRRVFDRPPAGQRKIVLSTNVAETSITIDDVTTVIDTGRAREVQYDPERRLSALTDAWCSRNAAKQRRGRAGRAQPGVCFRTYSSRTFALEMAEANPPEVLRVPLERLCLQIMSTMQGQRPRTRADGGGQQQTMRAPSVGEILAGLLTPPPPDSVRSAMDSLRGLSAVAAPESLTPLGRQLSAMPLDAPIGKMLIFGALLRCLDPLLKVAAALGAGRSLFVSPRESRDEADAAKRKFAAKASKSDHIAVVVAFNGWLAARRLGAREEREYVAVNFLSPQVLREMDAARFDLLDSLCDLGFVPRGAAQALRRHERSSDVVPGAGAEPNANIGVLEVLLRNAGSARVVKAALCAGLYPHVVRVEHPKQQYTATLSGAVDKASDAKQLKLFTREDGRVFLHPSSVQFNTGRFESNWLVYSKRMKTSKVRRMHIARSPCGPRRADSCTCAR